MSTFLSDNPDLKNEEYLEVSRNNMFAALDLFFRHTKYSITLLISMLTSVFAILTFSIKHLKDHSEKWLIVYVLGCVILLSMGPIALILRIIVTRYFRLYVSCYVYAARLHLRIATISHPWFDEINHKIKDIESSTAVDDYLDCVQEQTILKKIKFTKKINMNNWFYRHLINGLGLFGFVLGLLGFIYFFMVFTKCSHITEMPSYLV
jgi:hypothetical protein